MKGHLRMFFGLFICLLALVTPGLAQDKSSPGEEGKARGEETPVRIEYLLKDEKVPVGKAVIIRFKLLDKNTGEPKNDLQDARALVFRAPGIWQERTVAKFVEKGIYEFEATLPEPGVYFLFVEIQSLKVKFRDLPSHKFEAVEM